MDNCIFCNIISGKIPSQKIYEDNNTFVFLDIKPISKGHTLVVPKKHCVNITDISSNDAKACIETIRLLGPKIMKAMNADGFNIGMNNYTAAGQVVLHAHFHIIPRFTKDGLSSWPNLETDQKALEQVQKKILSSLK